VFARREFDWAPHADLLTRIRELFQTLLAWMDGLERTHPVSYYAVVVALAVILLAVLVHLFWVLRRAFTSVEPEVATQAAAFTPRRDSAWHMAEALRLSDAGRYKDALVHRYLALVLELDRRRAVRFHISKTPAEYATESTLDDESRGRLRTLVAVLYRHVFGAVPCGPGEWSAFDRDAAAVTRQLYAAPG
jgi:hypothetical protein